MLVLFETAAGHALFKVQDEGKLTNVDDIHKHFATADKANSLYVACYIAHLWNCVHHQPSLSNHICVPFFSVKLKAFNAFKDTTEAVAAAADCVDNTVGKSLKKFLKKHVKDAGLSDKLAVVDKAFGGVIKEKLGIQCVHDASIQELLRGIRTHMNSLISGLDDQDLKSMTL
ncbi:hypothetical protein AaE_001074, partial [Aphanomyces astaci]